MSIFHSKYEERVNFSAKAPAVRPLHINSELHTAGELANITSIGGAKSLTVVSAKSTGPVAQQIEHGRRLHSHKRAS